MNITHHMLLALFFLSTACGPFPRMVTNVSDDPLVAEYIRNHRVLVKRCDILVSGRNSILVEHGRRHARHDGFELKYTLAADTRVVLSKIERIQGDGFVLFEATGHAFPVEHQNGIPFSYKWGHGGSSPQAPWEEPGSRLKKIVGIE